MIHDSSNNLYLEQSKRRELDLERKYVSDRSISVVRGQSGNLTPIATMISPPSLGVRDGVLNREHSEYVPRYGGRNMRHVLSEMKKAPSMPHRSHQSPTCSFQ